MTEEWRKWAVEQAVLNGVVTVDVPKAAQLFLDFVLGKQAETFDLWMDGYGASKIDAIRSVRGVTGLGLREAKDLVEGVMPALLVSGITASQVDGYQYQMRGCVRTTALPATGATP